MPRKIEDSTILQSLQENGPSAAAELPHVHLSVNLRKLIHRFNILDGTSIYYLKDKHNAEKVLKKWIEENETILEHRSAAGVHRIITSNRGDEWVEPSRDMILDSVEQESNSAEDNLGNQDSKLGGECPLCGEEFDAHLRHHLPCDSTQTTE